jgi:hypothetical protein
LGSFGIFFPFWYVWNKKNLAALPWKWNNELRWIADRHFAHQIICLNTSLSYLNVCWVKLKFYFRNNFGKCFATFTII